MQTLEGNDEKGNHYYLAYIESMHRIIVWVDGKQKYIISTKGELSCDCPGNRYHGHCKHIDFAASNFNFTKTLKPKNDWKRWEENYYYEWLLNKEGLLWK